MTGAASGTFHKMLATARKSSTELIQRQVRCRLAPYRQLLKYRLDSEGDTAPTTPVRAGRELVGLLDLRD